MEAVRFFELNNGTKMPSIGLGTYKIDLSCIDAISTAVKVGYRHIDTAQLYENQKEIGVVLKKLFEDGVVKREDLWITSKLWCSDHEPEDVPKALHKTLQELQLDYLDLYLIHWPVSVKKGSGSFSQEHLTQPNIPNTWKAMEALYDSGLVRAIGVSNFSLKKLGDLLEVARVRPAVNQVECHPSWKQTKLKAYCKSKRVHLSGYMPLARTRIFNIPDITFVAEKLGKTPAQVALRWGLQMGHSILPKSSREAKIKENFDVFDWSIPEDLLEKFSEIEQEKITKCAIFVHETYGVYRTLEELWDGEI